MLISRDAWQRAGLFDERLDSPPRGSRLLLAGAPRGVPRADDAARARPSSRRVRRGRTTARRVSGGRERYYEERAAIAAMLKNYSLPSLLWLLPLAILIGLVRLAYLVLARRFEEALDLLAAWGWNIVHLPGTIARRVRAQSVREGSAITSCAGSWSPQGCGCLDGSRPRGRSWRNSGRSRRRTRTPPSAGGCAIEPPRSSAPIPSSSRRSWGRWWPRSPSGASSGPSRLHGGALPAFPSSWQRVLRRAGVRLPDHRTRRNARGEPRARGDGRLSRGSRSAARPSRRRCCSPAARSLAVDHALPRRWRGSPAVPARRCSGPCPTDCRPRCCGRSPKAASRCWWRCACSPSSLERLEVAFGPGELPDGRWRFIAGLAVTFAVGMAFMPGVVLAAAVLVVVQVLFGSSRRRGLGIAAAAFAAAAVLLLPVRAHHRRRRCRRPRLPHRHHGPRGARPARGRRRAGDLGRSPRSCRSPPLLAFSLVEPRASRDREPRGASRRSPASRSRGCRRPATCPRWAANAPVYLALAAVGEALIVGLGLSSVLSGLGRESFGLRQIGTGAAGGGARRRDRCCNPSARWSAAGRWAAPMPCLLRGPSCRAARRPTSACCGWAPTRAPGSSRPVATPKASLPNGAVVPAIRPDGTGGHTSRRTRAARSPVPVSGYLRPRPRPRSSPVRRPTAVRCSRRSACGSWSRSATTSRPTSRASSPRRSTSIARERPGSSSIRNAAAIPPAAVLPADDAVARTVEIGGPRRDRTTAVVPHVPRWCRSREDGRVRRPRPGSRSCRRSSSPRGGSMRRTATSSARPRRSAGRRSSTLPPDRSTSGSPTNGCAPGRPSCSVCCGWWRCGSPGSRWRDESPSGTPPRRPAVGDRACSRSPCSSWSSAAGSRSSEASALAPPARRRPRRRARERGSAPTAEDRSSGRPRCSWRTPARARWPCGSRRSRPGSSGSRRPSRCRRRPPCPCRFRPRDGRPPTFVEYFDGWVAASWVAQGGGGEIGVGAEPCAPATVADVVRPRRDDGAGRGRLSGGDESVRRRRGVRRRVADAETRADQELGADGSRPSPRQERGVPVERVRRRRSRRGGGGRRLVGSRRRLVARGSRGTAASAA